MPTQSSCRSPSQPSAQRQSEWMLTRLQRWLPCVAGVSWTETEHKQFLAGLQKLGKVCTTNGGRGSSVAQQLQTAILSIQPLRLYNTYEANGSLIKTRYAILSRKTVAFSLAYYTSAIVYPVLATLCGGGAGRLARHSSAVC